MCKLREEVDAAIAQALGKSIIPEARCIQVFRISQDRHRLCCQVTDFRQAQYLLGVPPVPLEQASCQLFWAQVMGQSFALT